MIADRLDLQWGNLVVGYKPEVDDNLGWCVLKRRPRAYAPDEAIFDEKTGVNTVKFKAWWPNMQRINSEKEMKWWLTYEAEKFNNDQDPNVREFTIYDDVKIRITGDGGNLKAFYRESQTSTHIKILAYDYLYPGYANNDTFENNPHLISLCSAIDASGKTHKIADGIDPLYFQVCKREEGQAPGIWVEKSKVIMLDQKPAVWTKADVMKQWM